MVNFHSGSSDVGASIMARTPPGEALFAPVFFFLKFHSTNSPPFHPIHLPRLIAPFQFRASPPSFNPPRQGASWTPCGHCMGNNSPPRHESDRSCLVPGPRSSSLHQSIPGWTGGRGRREEKDTGEVEGRRFVSWGLSCFEGFLWGFFLFSSHERA